MLFIIGTNDEAFIFVKAYALDGKILVCANIVDTDQRLYFS